MEVSTCIGQHIERSQLGSQSVCVWANGRADSSLVTALGTWQLPVLTAFGINAHCPVPITHTAMLHPTAGATNSPHRDCDRKCQ